VGASWVRENILQRYPNADVTVYAVWVPALAGDSRGDWDGSVLADRRVRQFWDDGSTASAWLGEHAANSSGLFYDVWILFGPDARWEQNSITKPQGQGATVIGTTSQLKSALGLG
jgi:hypothetical protein